MKKILFLTIFMALAIMLAACGSTETPTPGAHGHRAAAHTDEHAAAHRHAHGHTRADRRVRFGIAARSVPQADQRSAGAAERARSSPAAIRIWRRCKLPMRPTSMCPSSASGCTPSSRRSRRIVDDVPFAAVQAAWQGQPVRV